MASAKKKQDEKNLKILRDLASQPHNKKCFDCGQRGPTYVNMTIGSFVCTACSGILRGINPPQRVKSISMTCFTPQEIEYLQGAGNEMCKKTWLGLWNSANAAEPESRDEQKVKDFMIQKYERRRWYIPPQQAGVGTTNDVKPLKQLVGQDGPTLVVGGQPVQSSASTTPRERPRTVSQSSLPGVVPAPPTSQVVAAPQPAPVQVTRPAPTVDLLADLGGDPFGQTQGGGGFAAFGQTPQAAQPAGIPGFDAFGQQPAAPTQAPFDPFGSSAPQPVASGFANFSQPPQQQIPQQAAQVPSQGGGFDAFGLSSSTSPGFNAFGTQPSSGLQPSSSQPGGFGGPLAPASSAQASSFGLMVSAVSTAPTATSTSASDRYAALSALDSLFGPGSGGGSTGGVSSSGPSSTTGGGSVFGSSSSSSLGMSSGPNPFATGGGTATAGGFPQQQPAQPSNPFQGLGGMGGVSGAGFGQMNGPGRSMSPASNLSSGTPASGGFGSFTPVQSQSVAGFGQPAPQQQGGWGGMQTSSAQQNLSFGGAGMTAMAASQFGKMPPQNPQMGGQPVYGSGQAAFGAQPRPGMQSGQQGFAAQPNAGMQGGFGGMPQMGGAGLGAQPASGGGFGGQTAPVGQGGGFGGQWGSFGGQAVPTSQSGGFGGQSGGYGAPGAGMQQGGGFPGGMGGAPGGFPGQSAGFGAGQGGAAFGGKMMGVGMGGQFGQPQQQQQQLGGWQQGAQQNPFMGAGGGGGMPQMQRQSNNPFM